MYKQGARPQRKVGKRRSAQRDAQVRAMRARTHTHTHTHTHNQAASSWIHFLVPWRHCLVHEGDAAGNTVVNAEVQADVEVVEVGGRSVDL